MFTYPDDERVWGVDVSFYQDDPATPKGMDFGKVKEQGASFAFIKAGQKDWIDPDFIANWNAAREAGLPRAPYFFLDARDTGTAQATRYLKLMNEHGWGEMPPVVDYEHAIRVPLKNGHGRTVSRMTYNTPEQLDAFMKVMEGAPRRPIIYTNYYYWREHGSPYSIWSTYDLWIANYNPEPQIPPPWSTFRFHQFTSHGPGRVMGAESENVDLDYFNGTDMQFGKYLEFYGGSTTPPAPDEKVKRNLVLDEVIRNIIGMKE